MTAKPAKFGLVIGTEAETVKHRFRYLDAEWEGVTRLLPHRSAREHVCRIDIERLAARVIDDDFPTPPTNREMAAKWRRVAKAAEELERALSEVVDEDEGDAISRMCSTVLHQSEGWIDAFESRRTKRRSDNDPGLARIIGNLLELWKEGGGKLSYSLGDGVQPKGPLIRFLMKALAPINAAGAKKLSPSQLAHFIRKSKKKRALRSPNHNDGFE
jgi:hypothetical protein